LVNLGIEDILLEDAPNRGVFLNELICDADKNLLCTINGFVIFVVVIVFVFVGVLFFFFSLRCCNLLPGAFLIGVSESAIHQIWLTALDKRTIEIATFLSFVHFRILFILFATCEVLLDCFTSSWFATLWSLNLLFVFFNELNKSFVFKFVEAV
jgi:hypothetical protein